MGEQRGLCIVEFASVDSSFKKEPLICSFFGFKGLKAPLEGLSVALECLEVKWH